MMLAADHFSTAHRAAISALCADLSGRVGRPVVPDYAQTDCGQSYVSLAVEELPEGSLGSPGPLATLLAGPGISGFAMMNADGSAGADGVTFEQATRAARKAGALEYRRKTRGAWVA